MLQRIFREVVWRIKKGAQNYRVARKVYGSLLFIFIELSWRPIDRLWKLFYSMNYEDRSVYERRNTFGNVLSDIGKSKVANNYSTPTWLLSFILHLVNWCCNKKFIYTVCSKQKPFQLILLFQRPMWLLSLLSHFCDCLNVCIWKYCKTVH